MPVGVSEMSYAMSRVVTASRAKPLPMKSVARRRVEVGQGLVAGKTRENERKAVGINDAVANATRPQTSVWIPLSTPPIPSTHPAMHTVSAAKRQLVLLSRRANHI